MIINKCVIYTRIELCNSSNIGTKRKNDISHPLRTGLFFVRVGSFLDVPKIRLLNVALPLIFRQLFFSLVFPFYPNGYTTTTPQCEDETLLLFIIIVIMFATTTHHQTHLSSSSLAGSKNNQRSCRCARPRTTTKMMMMMNSPESKSSSSNSLTSSSSLFGNNNDFAASSLRRQIARTTTLSKSKVVKVSAAASFEISQEAKKTALLGVLFGGWYAFNIVFNIYNKQVLKAFPYPWHCTMFQFMGGCVLIALMWGLNLVERPKKEVFSTENLKMVLPLAMIHTLGNLLTNISLGKVAVSFTHTIKAMEPFFSVLFSYLFLGATPSPAVVAALVPVVGGVALASLAEASFNWIGFGAAMGSNVVFQSRNVFSKKVMGGNKGVKMDNITLFSVMTLLSAVISLPLAVVVEGVKFTPAALATSGFPLADMMQRVFITGATFHLYQQVSYMILQQVTPVTHSVGNCVKRVVVIASSVLFFRNPVSPLNLAGTAIALAGVFAYSQVAKKGGGGKSSGGAYTDEFRRITGLVNLKDN